MEFDITLKNYRCFSDEHPAAVELRRGLSAFVGPNNSGKSALLRFFYEFRPAFSLGTNKANWQHLTAGQAMGFNPPGEVLDFEELFSFTNDRAIEIQIVPKNTAWEGRAPTLLVPRRGQSVQLTLRGVPPKSITAFQDESDGETHLVAGQLRLPYRQFEAAMTCLQESIYIGAFRNALNRGGESQNYFDIPVGEYFISTWNECQTGSVKRLNKAAARVVEDVTEIFGFKTLAISAAPQNRSLSFVINGRPLKDHEVGSGLTQVLMVLATVAMRQPTYVLIDEPELNLHPALQVKFLLALASYAREGVLFGTHSVGLAKTVADRIFSVQQLKEGRSEIRPYEDTKNLAELLGEMSFSAYREIGFEKVLLVEGRTDVRVIQQFLRLLKKDHKIIAVPLGGSAMISGGAEHELSELRRLCDNVVAVIDSERANAEQPVERPRTEFAAVCQRLGIVCKILDRRAIENYLPATAIAKAFPDHRYRQLSLYERLSEVNLAWGKTENWRIASEMTLDELLATDLGAFLSQV